MGTLYKIAFRNLLRHKRRTLLTGVVITMGLLMYIFMDSVMSGLDRGSIDNMINLSTSAVKIHTMEYEEDKESFPLKYGLDSIGAIEKVLRSDGRVTGIAPRTQFLGELSNYEQSMPVIGTVIDPPRDRTVFTLTEHLIGNYFSSDNARQIILGKSLAADLGVGPGDFITLFALTKYESRNADDFKVIGLLNTTDPALNKSGVFITFDAANEFLDLENTVTELNVQLQRRVNFDDLLKDMRAVRAMVENRFSGLATLTFEEIGAGVLELVRQKKAWGVVMTLVLLLIAAVGIVNSVLMSVYERIREVGVMRAMGFSGPDIRRMFMLEGLMIGFVGSMGGVLLGIIAVWILTTVGWPLDALYGDMYVDTSGFPVWGTIYGEWNVPLIAGSFVFGMVVSFLASIPPSRKAAQMPVTQALRFT
ncbi:MAG: FtsX-like permease family protein [Chitinivibrionales bacterium]|nr:FtsX-like permease family protein [Chitinivibrionales bacterium]MBD3394272.1 FtsX-like permease family protein [Chitinivibrionales bacterium]